MVTNRHFYKSCYNTTRHISYSVLHHGASLAGWTLPDLPLSAVHAAACLTSEPPMHTDAIHQLPDPFEDIPIYHIQSNACSTRT